MHRRERLLGDVKIICILFLESVIISLSLISRQLPRELCSHIQRLGREYEVVGKMGE